MILLRRIQYGFAALQPLKRLIIPGKPWLEIKCRCASLDFLRSWYNDSGD